MLIKNIKKITPTLLLALVFTFCSTQLSAQSLIHFDDLPSDDATPLSSYQGFFWDNIYVIEHTTYDGYGTNGYHYGDVSPFNVAFNGYANPASFSASSPFTLTSLYATSAWYDGNVVTLQGFLGSTLLFSSETSLLVQTPTFINLNWAGIDSVHISTSNYQVALDNIAINGGATAVPEPSTYGLMGAGALLGIGILRRRQVKASKS